MGYDGAGAYNRTRNFSADASAGIKILASAMDEEIDDIASAMTLPLLKDGQNTPTANLPMGGFIHTNVGAPSSATNYMRPRDFIGNVPIYMEDAETSVDNISVSAAYFTTASANLSPIAGTKVIIKMGSNKGSAPAIHLNTGDGNPHSATVALQNASALYSGAILSGGIYEFIFASAASIWQLMNPSINTSNTDRPGIIQIATTAEADAGTDTTKAITPEAAKRILSANAATTTSAGIIEVATTAEASAGTDVSRAITPAAMAAVNAGVSIVNTAARASISAAYNSSDVLLSTTFATSVDNAMPYLATFFVSGSGTLLASNTKAATWVLQSGGSAGLYEVVHNIGLTSAHEMNVQIQVAVSGAESKGVAVMRELSTSSFSFLILDNLSASALVSSVVQIAGWKLP